MRRMGLVLAAMALMAAAPTPPLKLDRAVLLMRHGLRPPTKAPPMPAGTAADPWPGWSVPPGHLTPHGAKAIAALARADRRAWRAAGLLGGRGCATVRLVADSDQRTIATAQAYATALQPGCPAAPEHRPEGEEDPIFTPYRPGGVTLDPAVAERAVLGAAGPGGIAALERRLRAPLARLDAILCHGAPAPCGVQGEARGLRVAANARPKLSGALDRASTAAQILLLEYGDGKPAAEIGWGRARRADITRLGIFHALEFALLARPRPLAARNLAALGPLIRDALTAREGPAVTMISGHDTNVASLAGLLGVHWRIPGFAADDPSPGGAIMLERLRDRAGRAYVRAVYRSQTLRGLRAASPHALRQPLPLPGCRALGVPGLCPLRRFEALMTARLKVDGGL